MSNIKSCLTDSFFVSQQKSLSLEIYCYMSTMHNLSTVRQDLLFTILIMQRQIIYLLGLTTYIFFVMMGREIDVHAQLGVIDNTSPSITQDLSKVVDTSDISNPMRDGAYFGIKSPDGQSEINVINIGKIISFSQAQNQTLRLVQNIINYVLWFTALIILVYMIIEWYQVVVAGSDEEAYKAAVSKVKNAAIAVAGITLSWFIVSFIFYALNFVIQ